MKKSRTTKSKVAAGQNEAGEGTEQPQDRDEVIVNLPVFPRPPTGIGKHARKLWNEVGRGLYDDGRLTSVDLPAWQALCESWQRYISARDELAEKVKASGSFVEKTKEGYRKSPWLAIVHQEIAVLSAAISKFGMTPKDRSAINTELPNGPDEFGDLLKRKG